jgi:HlyD family secretion protein
VQLARVRVEDVTSRVRAPGKIEPSTQVKISADIMGKIIRLAVKEGIASRRAAAAPARRRPVSRHVQPARAAVASARARRSEAAAAMKVSDANYSRQKSLFEQKAPLAGRVGSSDLESRVGTHRDVERAEEVTRSEAALSGAADNLSKTRFVAPIDGMISALNVEAGEIVIMGTMNNPGTEILVVSDMSRMLVRADVDETDVVDMRLGQARRSRWTRCRTRRSSAR